MSDHPLKQWRDDHHLDLLQAAKQIGIDGFRLKELEVGREPTSEEYQKITRVTGLTQANFEEWVDQHQRSGPW